MINNGEEIKQKEFRTNWQRGLEQSKQLLGFEIQVRKQTGSGVRRRCNNLARFPAKVQVNGEGNIALPQD